MKKCGTAAPGCSLKEQARAPALHLQGIFTVKPAATKKYFFDGYLVSAAGFEAKQSLAGKWVPKRELGNQNIMTTSHHINFASGSIFTENRKQKTENPTRPPFSAEKGII
jgi:hypothetical protein